MAHRILIAAALAALVAAPAVAGVAQWRETKPYDHGYLGDVFNECGQLGDSGNHGIVCFSLTGAETTVSITIEDDAGWPVGAAYIFEERDGYATGSGSFCGSTDQVSIPAGTNELEVWLSGPAWGPVNCLGESVGVATSGNVTAALE